MKKIICTILIICVAVFSYKDSVQAEDQFVVESVHALSAAAIDGETGRVLLEKDGYNVRPMASTTKIMTLILALEYGDLESIVTVSSYAAKMPEVRLGIKQGEQYQLKDLLYAMMLESYNDCAVAIAEHISGSTEQFAALMNEKARELGLSHTYFITPNGLDASDGEHTHSTNAVELCLLMKYCVDISTEKDMFLSICQTKSYDFKDSSNKKSFTVTNKNKLIYDNQDMLAGKTGFTADAGYCYVCAIKYDDTFVVIALLGCGWPPNKTYKWKDVTNILNALRDGYEKREVFNHKNFNKTITVYDGYSFVKVPVLANEDLELLLCEADVIDIKVIYNKLKTPIQLRESIGYLEISVNGSVVKTIPCYSGIAVDQISYQDFVYSIFRRFFFQ